MTALFGYLFNTEENEWNTITALTLSSTYFSIYENTLFGGLIGDFFCNIDVPLPVVMFFF